MIELPITKDNYINCLKSLIGPDKDLLQDKILLSKLHHLVSLFLDQLIKEL